MAGKRPPLPQTQPPLNASLVCRCPTSEAGARLRGGLCGLTQALQAVLVPELAHTWPSSPAPCYLASPLPLPPPPSPPRTHRFLHTRTPTHTHAHTHTRARALFPLLPAPPSERRGQDAAGHLGPQQPKGRGGREGGEGGGTAGVHRGFAELSQSVSNAVHLRRRHAHAGRDRWGDTVGSAHTSSTGW